MEVNNLAEAVKFMMLGMGTVFLFLVLMIVAMNIQSKIIHRFFPEPNQGQGGNTTSQNAGNKNNKIAAITAAILHHKKING